MDNNQAVYKYCQNNPVHYIAISETIKRGLGETVYAGRDGLVVVNPSGDTTYLSVKNAQTFLKVMPLLNDYDWILLHEISYRDQLENNGFHYHMEPAFSAAYFKPDIELPKIKDLEIHALAEKDLPFVLAHYRLIHDEGYLRERINYGMLGAFYHDSPAGFIGIHEEGSMGMLEVLPGFRRLGIGAALTAYMVKQELKRGHIPYAQHLASNAASRFLQQKMGFTISDKPLAWTCRNEW